MCIRDRIDNLEALLKDAVMQATVATPLRHNSVETFDEYNTGKNVGKGTPTVWSVSYTHLDVYKRQSLQVA